MLDPYQTLGVATSATPDEIKSAYKNLARKYHPDLNPGNREAEKKFKDIANAYGMIGTKEAKEKFDRGETDEQKQHMYEEYMKNQGQQQRSYYRDTQGSNARYSSSFEGFDDDIFSQFFNRASKEQQDEEYRMEVDFLEAVRGSEKTITLPNGKKIQVKIPAGIRDGQKLKFAGLAEKGDIYIQISISPSSEFKRDGNDIHTEIPVSVFEAMHGAEVDVKTIDGTVKLTIPPGVSSGSKLRVKGKGIGKGNDRGNQIVTIKIVLPKSPSPELQTAFSELEKRFGYQVRGET